MNAALNPQLPYHPVDDFTPITQLTSAGLMLVVNPKSPPQNLAEFIEWTKSFKGALNFGSAGIGSGGHLAGELYKQMTGVKAEHIPYKGAGPAMADLVAGQYHYNFSGLRHAPQPGAGQDPQPARRQPAHPRRRLRARRQLARGLPALHERRPREMGEGGEGERREDELNRGLSVIFSRPWRR